MVVYFIGESGSFYRDEGLIAENSEVLWNEYYGSYTGGISGCYLTWNEMDRGEHRKRSLGSGKGTRKYL